MVLPHFMFYFFFHRARVKCFHISALLTSSSPYCQSPDTHRRRSSPPGRTSRNIFHLSDFILRSVKIWQGTGTEVWGKTLQVCSDWSVNITGGVTVCGPVHVTLAHMLNTYKVKQSNTADVQWILLLQDYNQFFCLFLYICIALGHVHSAVVAIFVVFRFHGYALRFRSWSQNSLSPKHFLLRLTPDED